MNNYKRVISALLTLVLVVSGWWLLRYSRQQRQIFYKDYAYTEEEAKRLSAFSSVQHSYGLRMPTRNDDAAAAEFFRLSVPKNPIHIASWLKLAEAEMALGNAAFAREILQFTDGLTGPVPRWKWPQALLAHELGVNAVFNRNINYLVVNNQKRKDAFHLLDIHYTGNVDSVLAILDSENLVYYLRWLIRSRRQADARSVWEKIREENLFTPDVLLKYVHFLINQKSISEANVIWAEHTGTAGITNSGFEEEITRQGFDWRYGVEPDDFWKVKRVDDPVYEGSNGLQVSFSGRENIAFRHLYQIVPVDPSTRYRLSYWWRSEEITTDQGLFAELFGYDCKGFYTKGEMITGTRPWTQAAIEFTSPATCRAVVIRLRRIPSKRFDCNIAGTLWLDNFRLESMGQ